MHFKQRIIDWANVYIAKYPIAKIYMDKVGPNLYGMSGDVDKGAEHNIRELSMALDRLPVGHFVIQLKENINDKAAAKFMNDFDITPYDLNPHYQQSFQQNVGIGAISSQSPVVQGITAEEVSKMIADEKQKWETDQQIKDLKEQIKKLKEPKQTNSVEQIGSILKAVEPYAPLIKGFLTGNQVGIAGFDHVNKVPVEHSAADKIVSTAYPKEATDTETTPEEDNQLNRIYTAIDKFITDAGSDLKGMTDVADMIEGLYGYKLQNTAMYNVVLPQILECKKHYIA
jgi:hypothetical protein